MLIQLCVTVSNLTIIDNIFLKYLFSSKALKSHTSDENFTMAGHFETDLTNIR